ncbi:MAG: peptidoglycan-binding domain-containing protein [Alphaproteobacteria bacterium]
MGGGSRTESEAPAPVIEAPAPERYTLIGGPVGDALVEGREPLREAQSMLATLGFDPGPADGLMGPRTRSALEQFQTQQGVPVSGTLTVDTQGALQFEKSARDDAAQAANSTTAAAPAPAASVRPASAGAPSSVAASTTGSGTWTAFLSGEDIRAHCTASSPDEYRFVYNAEYTEHVRLYELTDTSDGSAVLNIIVRGPTRIAGDPARLMGRISGKRSINGLAPFERNSLIETLMSSGFTSSPLPSGTVLPSDGHFWVVSACRRGTFTVNAWTYPSDRWDRITFPGMLGQLDFTNVMFNPLSQLTEAQRAAARSGDGPLQAFDIRVGADGKFQIN